MCLWNGLIAAAPGHPFLAKAIEMTVNRIRNRFTSVDVDATLCPYAELSLSHAFDTLFLSACCLLGAAVNNVLGRHDQSGYRLGELKFGDPSPFQVNKEIVPVVKGADTRRALAEMGRTILLRTNREE